MGDDINTFLAKDIFDTVVNGKEEIFQSVSNRFVTVIKISLYQNG